MLDITLEQLIGVLGEPTKRAGHQYYFRCPACALTGGDRSGDNLLFNDRKGVLKCFACDDGAKYALHLINKNSPQAKHTIKSVASKPVESWWQANTNNLWQYWVEANDEMTKDARRWLNDCGITNETIEEWLIGFDGNPSIVHIGPCVSFPMISINHNNQLVGFELRQVGKNKVIRHTYDSPNCLCIIADNKDATKLVICEGFKDAYSFMQILKKKNNLQQYTILTPSHGVNTIIGNLNALNFSRYTKCFLLLDNDEAGTKVTQEIKAQYKFFKDARSILKDHKDVNELWVKEYV